MSYAPGMDLYTMATAAVSRTIGPRESWRIEGSPESPSVRVSMRALRRRAEASAEILAADVAAASDPVAHVREVVQRVADDLRAHAASLTLADTPRT